MCVKNDELLIRVEKFYDESACLYGLLLADMLRMVNESGGMVLGDDSDCTYTYMNGGESELFTIESVCMHSDWGCLACKLDDGSYCRLDELNVFELCHLYKSLK